MAMRILESRPAPVVGSADVTMASPPLNASRSEGMQVDAGAGAQSVADPSSSSNAEEDAAMAEAPRRQRPHSEAPMRKLSVNLIDTYKLINQVCVHERDTLSKSMAPV